MEQVAPITRFSGDPLPRTSERQWACERKVTYASRKEARRHRHPGMSTYRCPWCRKIHLTTRRKEEL
jgi:hypothetical protein